MTTHTTYSDTYRTKYGDPVHVKNTGHNEYLLTFRFQDGPTGSFHITVNSDELDYIIATRQFIHADDEALR